MTVLRLIADDLTGALDAGAPFVARTGPLPVRWTAPVPPPRPGASLVLDGGSRELAAGAAAEAAARLAPILTGAGLAFKKIDSLLRGHVALELDACLTAAAGGFAACVLAPAFPFQGRVTRGGRQHVRGRGGAWTPLATDLAAELSALGRPPVPVRRPDDLLRVEGGGIALCVAETDTDLAAIVVAGRRLGGPALWCGTGGLAAALAGDAPAPAAPPPPRPPLLIIVGSDHPVARRQVEVLVSMTARPVRIEAGDDAPGATAARLRGALDGGPGLALLTFRLAPGATRATAAAGIRERLARVLPALDAPPSGLIVTGGATLLAAALAVDADHLELHGQLMPGVPVSRVRGGPWDGVAVASKSGAFGAPDLLARLAAPP
ncbi:MAG TPA: four-carbon acid sugar kinase family protein [Geminicoccaceae bacterium]|nr:four-carbon acid sugar kinase family protein [Geminicoccaceae bacterium]